MPCRRSASVLLIWSWALWPAACSTSAEGELPGDGPATGSGPDAAVGFRPDGGGVIFDPCTASPSPGYDPVASGLTACCTDEGAPAHCVPASEVTPKLVDNLKACPGGNAVCVPDPIIRAG